MKHDIENAIADLTIDEDAQRASASFCFRADLPIFSGHFPGMPILPGIYLVEAARSLAERCADRRLRIAEVTDAKFLGEVHPEERFRGEIGLTVKASEDDGEGPIWRVDAGFFRDAARVARVRLRLRAE